MGFYRGPIVSLDGLVLHLDAANPKSYSGAGSVWKDLSGNGNDGTLIGSIGFNSDNSGSLTFSGISDSVSVGNSSELNIQNNITISIWFYYNENNPSTYSINLISKMNTTSSSNFSFYFDGSYSPSRVIVLATRGGVWGAASPRSGILETGKWHNIVWKYSDGGYLYVNGVFLGRDLSSGLLGSASNGINIGGGLSGGISTVMIYNRALSNQEVSKNYDAMKCRFSL